MPTNILFDIRRYKHYFIFLSLFLPLVSQLKAQRPDASNAQSQFQQSPTTANAQLLGDAYLNTAEWFSYIPQFNQDSIIVYAEKGIALLESQTQKNNQWLGQAYLKYANLCVVTNKRRLLLQKSKTYSDLTNDNLLKYRAYFKLACMIQVSNEANALEMFNAANKFIENNRDPSVQAELTWGFGFFYRYFQESSDFSYQNCMKSFRYYTENRDSTSSETLYKVYKSMFGQMFSTQKYDSTTYYLKQMEDLLPKLNLFARIHYELDAATFYKRYQEFDKDEAHANRANELIQKYHLNYSDMGAYVAAHIAQVQERSGVYDAAIASYKLSLNICDSVGIRSMVRDVLEMLSHSYSLKGDYENAYKTQRLFLGEAMTYLEQTLKKESKEFEIKYDVSTKEQALVKQQAERQLLWLAILFFAVTTGLLVFFFFRERKDKAIIEQQSQELHQLDAAKSRFYANVSHELRTPLTLILAPLSTMIKSQTLDNRNFTLASLVRQNAQSLLKLVNEILDLNKLEANKLTLQEDKTVVYNLIRRIVANFESAAEMQKIHFTFNYEADQYLQLMLDTDKFEKILNNLLSNAVKFTLPNGQITVVVKDVQNKLRVVVTDTGRGIHPDDLPHIFNRFYQSNQPDALIEGGTGIGLSLSSELTRLMGGQLTVESVFHKGSSFRLELPKKEVLGTVETQEANEMLQDVPVKVQSDTPFIAETRNGAQKTILIVEDNKSLRDYMSLILSPHFNTLKAENGQVALNILEGKHKPDLILSDVMMPIMDGFQLLSALKSSDTYCAIPVVMLTARAELQDKLKALRIGVDDYLVKPFEEEELFARIENLLRHVHVRQNPTESLISTEPIMDEVEVLDTEGGISTPSISVSEMAWLADLETAVKQNIKDTHYSVERMASDMALSRTQLFRKLKQLTGLSPQQYLQEVRLQQALFLLETKQTDSVKGTCYAVGLLQVKHFSQLFQDRFGRLPSTYL